VIGGKYQRVSVAPTSQSSVAVKTGAAEPAERPRRPDGRKNKRKAKRKEDAAREVENLRQRRRAEAQRLSQLCAKHMSHQQRCFAQLHHCFLLRNLDKVRRVCERLKQATAQAGGEAARPSAAKQSEVFLTHLNALSTPRNVRTRRLAQAEDDPEVARNARLAVILRDLYNALVGAKGESPSNDRLVSLANMCSDRGNREN